MRAQLVLVKQSVWLTYIITIDDENGFVCGVEAPRACLSAGSFSRELTLGQDGCRVISCASVNTAHELCRHELREITSWSQLPTSR